MARIRSVHPGFFTDEATMAASPMARILLIGLWTECDDNGAFAWKPLTLKARIAPTDNVDIEALLGELERLQCLRSYEHDGIKLGLVRNFGRFQRPKKPKRIHFIPPEFRTWAGLTDDGSELSPQREEGGEDGEETKPKGFDRARARGTRWELGKTVQSEWIAEVAEIRKRAGLPPINAQFEAAKFADFWAAKSGKDGTKSDWHATWRNWVRNARSSGNAPPGDGPRMGPA